MGGQIQAIAFFTGSPNPFHEFSKVNTRSNTIGLIPMLDDIAQGRPEPKLTFRVCIWQGPRNGGPRDWRSLSHDICGKPNVFCHASAAAGSLGVTACAKTNTLGLQMRAGDGRRTVDPQCSSKQMRRQYTRTTHNLFCTEEEWMSKERL